MFNILRLNYYYLDDRHYTSFKNRLYIPPIILYSEIYFAANKTAQKPTAALNEHVIHICTH